MQPQASQPKGSRPRLEDLPQPVLDRITNYVFADDLPRTADTSNPISARNNLARFATVSKKWQLAVERLLWTEVHLSVQQLDQLPRLVQALLSKLGGHRAGFVKTVRYEGEVVHKYGETRKWDGECKKWEAYGPLYQLLAAHKEVCHSWNQLPSQMLR